eukprot:scaffold200472_cov32-Tisochrysis_lutea.AAC.1
MVDPLPCRNVYNSDVIRIKYCQNADPMMLDRNEAWPFYALVVVVVRGTGDSYPLSKHGLLNYK